MTVKIPMMMLQYVVMFTVPTVVGYYYWNPRSNEEIRKDVEFYVKPDTKRREQRQQKFTELLLPKRGVSEETKQQLDDVTAFARPDRKEQWLKQQQRKQQQKPDDN